MVIYKFVDTIVNSVQAKIIQHLISSKLPIKGKIAIE